MTHHMEWADASVFVSPFFIELAKIRVLAPHRYTSRTRGSTSIPGKHYTRTIHSYCRSVNAMRSDCCPKIVKF
jgi:hypothetical protein